MQRAKRLYCTYDRVSRQYGQKVWEAVNDDDAMRAFMNEMQNAPKHVNPLDYSLHHVGTWDMIDGRLEGFKDKNNEFIMAGEAIGVKEDKNVNE